MKQPVRNVWMLLLIGLFLLAIVWVYFFGVPSILRAQDNIKVGVLFSQTGTMSQTSRSALNATLLAIDEINQAGGIDNRQLVPIVYDAESDSKKHATLAEKMIVQDGVSVIFGCWTSASRKEVKPIVEKYNNLLVYSIQSEGVEESNHIIYLGATPNQFIIPAVAWILKHHAKKVFLVGSELLFSYITNEILQHELHAVGAEIVGVQYIPFKSAKVASVIQKIITQKPSIIFSTITGYSNVAFFNALFTQIPASQRPPVLSFRLTGTDMNTIGREKLAGDYLVWSYFGNLINQQNTTFLRAYRKKYGPSRDVNDPAVTAYSGVYLWAQAVQEAHTDDPVLVREVMLRQSIASPAGPIYIDPNNGHAWRTVMIGRVNQQGHFDLVWSSLNPIQPVVYPEFKTRTQWDLLEYQLFLKWNQSWENQGESNGE